MTLVLSLSFRQAYAVFNEQIAVDARAISLANTCTADPPGLMSVHYNPAGLSLLNEGKTFGNGFGIPVIKRTGHFKTADNFEGFMNGYWGPDPNKWPDTSRNATENILMSLINDISALPERGR